MNEKEVKREELNNDILDEVNGGNIVTDALGMVDDHILDIAKSIAVSTLQSTSVGRTVMDVVNIVEGIKE